MIQKAQLPQFKTWGQSESSTESDSQRQDNTHATTIKQSSAPIHISVSSSNKSQPYNDGRHGGNSNDGSNNRGAAMGVEVDV